MPMRTDPHVTRRFELELMNRGLSLVEFCERHNLPHKTIWRIARGGASAEHPVVPKLKKALRKERVDGKRGMERVRRPKSIENDDGTFLHGAWRGKRRADVVRCRLGVTFSEIARATDIPKPTVHHLLSGYTQGHKRRSSAAAADERKKRIADYLRARGACDEELGVLWEPAVTPVTELEDVEPEFRRFLEGGHLMLSEESLSRWKLARDPFGEFAREGEGLFWGRNQKKASQALKRAVREQYLAALVGRVGTGKTELWRHVQRELEQLPGARHMFVYLRDLTQEKITPQQVQDAMLDAVHGRDVFASRQKRLKLLVQSLKMQRDHGRIVTLVVEEGQLLSDTILRTFKGLAELCDGFAKLVGIILIAQTQIDEVLRSTTVEEVRRRLRVITYAGIHHLEIEQYLDTRLTWVGSRASKVFDGDALRELEHKDYRVVTTSPLGLGNVASQAMEIALYRNHSKVSRADMEEALRRGDRA